MFEGTQEEKLTQVLTIVQALYREVESIKVTMTGLKDENLHPLSTQVALLLQRVDRAEADVKELDAKTATISVDEDRIKKLENWVYGAISVTIAQLLGGIVALVMWLTKGGH